MGVSLGWVFLPRGRKPANFAPGLCLCHSCSENNVHAAHVVGGRRKGKARLGHSRNRGTLRTVQTPTKSSPHTHTRSFPQGPANQLLIGCHLWAPSQKVSDLLPLQVGSVCGGGWQEDRSPSLLPFILLLTSLMKERWWGEKWKKTSSEKRASAKSSLSTIQELKSLTYL